MEKENKVMFGLKNVYYAKWDGEKYLLPVPIPGAVNMALNAEGEMEKFYADDVVYYVANQNNGYSGDLEVALYPDQMLQDIWGYELSATDKVLTENANVEPASFALLFQISGDVTNSHYAMYACTASRPGINAKTKEGKSTPQTQKSSLTAVPKADGKVFAKTTANTPKDIVNNWYISVYTGEVAA